MSDVIRIVSATRVSAEEFENATLLGASLRPFREAPLLERDVAFNNSDGLPAVYNRAIERAKDSPAILVFVHDDVYIADTIWMDEIRRCLAHFDLVGLAGNKRRVANQPAWAFAQIVNGQFAWDDFANLSGVVGHGEPPGEFSVYGPVHQPCVLLDGLMLIVRSAMLHERELRFDARFTFHLYDMDFCRQAELKQLRMGTGCIKVIHRSGGSFGSPEWVAAYQEYLRKYGS